MPDPTQASGLFWATVFGAAVGVVAGTGIQYLLTLILQRNSIRRQRRALVKELTYNRALVEELSDELKRFRNSVNGHTFDKYFGFFNFGHAIFAQANASTGNGVLYELLSADEIRHAQRVVSLLSASNAKWVNDEITRRRNALIAGPTTFDWREAVSFVDFLDGQIVDLGKRIDHLIQKLR